MQSLSSTPDPALSIGISILIVLVGLTGFGLWRAFGKKVTAHWALLGGESTGGPAAER